MFCIFCHSNRHNVENCPRTYRGQINRSKMFCIYCHSHRHNVNACLKTWNGAANLAWHKNEIENDILED